MPVEEDSFSSESDSDETESEQSKLDNLSRVIMIDDSSSTFKNFKSKYAN